MTKGLCALLLLCAGLHADGTAPAAPPAPQALSPTPQPLSPPAQTDDERGVVYAPAGADNGDAAALAGSYLSRARISVFAWGRPQEELSGADVVLNGNYIGRSPVALKGIVMDQQDARLSARLDGYSEALRPAVRMPADGVVRVAVLSDNASAWYTAPGWVLGVGLLAASVALTRSDNTGTGLALAGAGVGAVALTQLVSRLAQLPLLRRAVERYNASREPAPQP